MAIWLLASPAAALAEVCDTERPDWDGAPVSALQEALLLASSLPSIILIVGTLLALRFRNQWGGLAVVCGWSFLIYLLTFSSDTVAVRQAAAGEGCVGSPTLFIAIVSAISVATILYTAPITDKSKP